MIKIVGTKQEVNNFLVYLEDSSLDGCNYRGRCKHCPVKEYCCAGKDLNELFEIEYTG